MRHPLAGNRPQSGAEKIEPRILTQRLVTPHPERLTYIRYALHQGMTVKELHKMTSIDPWFLYQLKEITASKRVSQHSEETLSTELLRKAKRVGISDERLALSSSLACRLSGACAKSVTCVRCTSSLILCRGI